MFFCNDYMNVKNALDKIAYYLSIFRKALFTLNSAVKFRNDYDDSQDYNYLNIMLIVTIVSIGMPAFYDYLIGGYPFFLSFNSDLLRANLPVYTMIYHNIISGWNNWSWEMGIGTSLITHADAIFDPFTYISFLRGGDNIAQMMSVMMLVKIVLEGVSFSYYLRYFNFNKYAILIASIMYSFSGYSMIMGSNLALGTILVYFPLVLLNLEKTLKNRCWGIIFVYFLIAIYSFYYFYIICIVSIVYYSFRLYILNSLKFKRVLLLLSYMIIASLLSSFILIPEVLLLFSTDRVNEGRDVIFGRHLFKPSLDVLITMISRTININLLGNNLFIPYLGKNHDYFSCELYISIFAIPLIGYLLWFYRNKKRENFYKYSVCLMSLIFLSILPVASYVMNGLSTINYRWFFIIHTYLCFCVSLIVHEIIAEKQINIVVLGKLMLFSTVLPIICSVMCVTYQLNKNYGDVFFKDYFYALPVFLGYILFLYVLFGLVAYIYNIKKDVRVFVMGVLLLLAIDYSGNYYNVFQYDTASYIAHKEAMYGYDDFSKDVIEEIKNNDDGFYRVYKDFDSVYDNNFVPSDNDALVQHYYGVKSYNSLNHPSYVSFLQQNGVYVAFPNNLEKYRLEGREPYKVKGPELNFINGIDDKYILLKYLGVKYYLSENNDFVPDGYYFVGQKNNIYVYASLEANALAQIKGKKMALNEFLTLDYTQRNQAIMEYVIVDEISQTTEMANNLGKVSSIVMLSPDELCFDVESYDIGKYLVMSIPFDKGWSAYIDGRKVPINKVDIGMSGVEIPPGKVRVELKYIPYGMEEGVVISLMTIFMLVVIIKVKLLNPDRI